MDRSKTIHLRIRSHEPFSMFYIHSIYQEPVIEEFLIEKEAIILKGVRTKSPAIMEYYGFEDNSEVIVPAVTWVTNITSVIQTKLKPVFVDVNLIDYSFDYEKLEKAISSRTRIIYFR